MEVPAASSEKKKIIKELSMPSFQPEQKPNALLKTENHKKELWSIATHLVFQRVVWPTCKNCMIFYSENKQGWNKQEYV